MIRKLLILGLFLFSLPSFAGESTEVYADNDSTTNSIVEVELKVIHATNAHKNVDERISHLMTHFKNYRYTGYKLLKDETAKIPDNEKKHWPLTGVKSVSVRVLQHDARKARLQVVVKGAKHRKLLDSTMVINRSGTFIVAGPRYKNGILFLPLSVTWK